MRFWLIQLGEPVPGFGADKNGARLMRTGLVAQELARRGHEVVWWASTWDHMRKEFRASKASRTFLESGVEIRLVHVQRVYQKNISLARILHHAQLARAFRREMAEEQPPDLLFSSMPTPDLSLAAVEYGEAQARPVVIDIRDLWPDDMVKVLPRPLQFAGRLFLAGVSRTVSKALRGATAIVGTNPDFVSWGCTKGGRAQTSADRDYPLAYAMTKADDREIEGAARGWDELGIVKGQGIQTCSFVGTLGASCGLSVVIDAARILEREAPGQHRFVICGNGPLLEEGRRLTAELENFHLPGFVRAPQIEELLRRTDVGLLPYPNRATLRANLPNKVMEYMCSGLPVVTSLGGLTQKTLEEAGAGVLFREGDASDLARKIQALKADPGHREGMGKAGKKVFEESYAAEDVYARFADHLEAIAKTPIRS